MAKGALLFYFRYHVVLVAPVIVIILAKVQLQELGAALIVESMAIGLETAKWGIGRTSAIDVVNEAI